MTLFQLYKRFDTDEKCIDFLIKIRWPDGVVCYHCGNDKVYRIKNFSTSPENKGKISRFKCAKCRKLFSVTGRTAFDSAKIPLWQFFYLIFSCAINKKNVSSYQNHYNLGISQKTTWHIMSKIRMLCFQDENLKLSGEVEVDETFIRVPKWKIPNIKRIGKNKKYPIMGLIERGGRVIVKVIPRREKKIVQTIILNHVEVGSKLFTDTAGYYFGLDSYYLHQKVNHSEREFARGEAHTNSIEAFWSGLKKAIVGTHHKVSQLHLQRYCDELAYRWNNRRLTVEEKFNDLIKRACQCGVLKKDKVCLDVKNKEKKMLDSYGVVDTSTGQVFKSVQKAAFEIGINDTSLWRMLNGYVENNTTLKKMKP